MKNTLRGKALGSLFVLLIACLALVVALLPAGPGRAAGSSPGAPPPTDGTEPLPPGATINTLLTGLDQPVAMAFDPQGRLFFTEKASGNVRLYQKGALNPSPVIHFAVNSETERGLLGIAIDPNFNANHYIYVYYTCAVGPGCPVLENRVARFAENNGVGSNPVTIFNSPQTAGNHNGGNIHFGPDGKLYITVGDNANAANSQDVTVKNGKIHRINPDGTIPSDNPVFTQTGALPSLFAMGLRNSFDFAFDPVGTRGLFASENGPGCDDELNRIVGGYNYGWRDNYPCDDPNPNMEYNSILPLWFLTTSVCCEAPTGVAFYTGNAVPQWHNELFMATYNTRRLRHVYLDSTRTRPTAVNIVQGPEATSDIETGPDGALWYIEGGGYETGTLRRIVGPGGGGTPSATVTRAATSTPTATHTPCPACPTPTASPTPCPINFTDVHPTDYFYAAVRYLYCSGAISGYADNTFRPFANVTRAQLSKIVVLAQGWAINTQGGPHFTDVPASNPFYSFVETAYNREIISGYAGSTFRPYNDVTRAQLSKIIVLAQGWPIDIGGGPHFTDVPGGDTFYGYIETAYNHGIVSGYADGTFRPGNPATRGQISKIVYAALTAP